MIETQIPLSQIVAVQHMVSPTRLDLSFSVRGTSDATRQALAGPGIYLISFGAEVIYIGKYQPIGGNIIVDRWLRHLETITMRGRRVGFGGSKNAARRLASLLQHVSSRDLRTLLEQHYEDRFKDTGVVTSKNRLGFADENWQYFSQPCDDSILSRFSIRLLRLTNTSSQSSASTAVSSIEKLVLKSIKPRCNKEFSIKLHNDRRHSNTVPAVIDHVKLCAARFGKDFTHCTSLIGNGTSRGG